MIIDVCIVSFWGAVLPAKVISSVVGTYSHMHCVGWALLKNSYVLDKEIHVRNSCVKRITVCCLSLQSIVILTKHLLEFALVRHLLEGGVFLYYSSTSCLGYLGATEGFFCGQFFACQNGVNHSSC